ncbi:phage protein, HK97 gp10 family [Bradyrhizobium sp. Rc3b]|uniref:HK97-gp10 family putative phage morphogenesis protein n=1 Tax=Bradyrhizobium sp. Rc3b TaxID=1855322 RepID=UPI0008EC88C2|nr:HK97-gp10 family putative phage morphogenesis protein [Bradyrhizobium sp. Rc3b]SFN02475.1 phage protein, HK97 gp10 family [Bradyrhizobium sp. Rc3b]
MPNDDFNRQISQLPFKLKRQLATAIAQEADRLAQAIKNAAPVRTGKLRDSVKVRRTKRDLTLEVTAGGESTTHGECGPHGEADYALFTEYGTRKTSAQPFFYPTARAMQADINSNIAKAVQDVLND